MSYSNLMQHANEIVEKAVAKSHEADEGGSRPPYDDAHYRQFYDDIPGLFQPFSDLPDPISYDTVIEDLADTLKKLSPGVNPKDPVNGDIYPANSELDKLSGAESYIEDWSGSAAMEFKSNVIDPFPSLSRNQFILASVLKGAIEAEKELWTKARDDVDLMAHKALEALDGVFDCGKNEWTMTFTVIASVASLAAIPLTAGSSAAITLSVVGAASQVAGAAAPDDPTPNSFAGNTPYEVVDSLRDALKKLDTEIGNAEGKIATAMKETKGLVAANRSLFVTRRPELAGATPGNIDDLLGYPH